MPYLDDGRWENPYTNQIESIVETSTPQTKDPSVRTSWIDLGAHRINIVLIPPEEREKYGLDAEDRGMWLPSKMQIIIVRLGGSTDLQVFMHELLHAMIYLSGWSLCGSDGAEEAMCDVLGERFAELFLRNPTVLEEWL